MKLKTKSLLALALAVAASGAMAKVSPQEAAKLGKELTPMGGEAAGNKAGTIPAYTGGLPHNPNKDPLADPFANEKPLFTITAQNYKKYEANLSTGQKALFEKHPTYEMPVYKTHRTAHYQDRIIEKAKKNALNTELALGGNGMKNFDETVPFAIPKTGVEIVWNHINRFRGGIFERNFTKLAVAANGSYVPVSLSGKFAVPYYLNSGYDAKKDDNILFYYMQSVKSPARLTGNVLLVHETIDQVTQPRLAWTYNAGQRRVRRAPQVAYDAPSEGSGGYATSDQTDIFNGSPDKYNWKLIGKQEMYIPYNSYKFGSQSNKYDDMIQAGHIKNEYKRYELHRVWVVEGTLREGERHIYGKRTFYVDEDSWQLAGVDQYDNRGELWRVSENHALQFVNVSALWNVGDVVYDLLSGGYLATLSNEEENSYDFSFRADRSDFTTSALRRSGKR